MDVLVELAASAGLPADEARRVIEERRFKAAVDADWALSARTGVTGVPTFIAGESRLATTGQPASEDRKQLPQGKPVCYPLLWAESIR